MQEEQINGLHKTEWIQRAALGTKGISAHFSPANGIPAASYDEFFEHLNVEIALSSTNPRSSWLNEPLPKRSFDWGDHADDLIHAIESHYSAPVVGIGHSMGADATLLASLKRPELFSRLVLIEPPTAPSMFSRHYLHHLPAWLVHRQFPFIRGSHQRKRVFESLTEFSDRYRGHPTYQHFTDRSFIALMQSGLVPTQNGKYELLCHPHWESHNFKKVEFIWPLLARAKHDILILRAEHSYLYDEQTFLTECAKLGSNVTARQIVSSHHLCTHETPATVANAVLDWLT